MKIVDKQNPTQLRNSFSFSYRSRLISSARKSVLGRPVVAAASAMMPGILSPVLNGSFAGSCFE